MRTSRIAIVTTTALLGLGTLLSQAGPASAGPPKGPGTIVIAPTTTTTMQPLEAEEVGYCDIHLCLPAEPVDPQEDGDLPIAQPPHVDPPVDDDLPLAQPADPDDPECNPHQPNCDEIAVPDGDDPECDPTLGSCHLGTDPGDPDDPGGEGTDEGTDERTDEGTDEGSDGGGRLAHTGLDLLQYLAAAGGLTGVGVGLKRLGRRA